MSEEHKQPLLYFKVCGLISAKSKNEAGDYLYKLLHDKTIVRFIRVSDEKIKGCRFER